MNGRRIRKRGASNRIRNGQIRRDFKRLLTIIAEASSIPYEELKETEAIAKRHALYFDDDGAVKENPEVIR